MYTFYMDTYICINWGSNYPNDILRIIVEFFYDVTRNISDFYAFYFYASISIHSRTEAPYNMVRNDHSLPTLRT